MYSAEPVIDLPENEHAKIWRYMDFTKFVSLIAKKALYFARADRFSDKFEGATPIPTIEDRENSILESGTPLIEEVSREWSQANRGIRKWMFLNCWHMNEYESAAMWQLYVQKNEGIAIRSTFARLKDSLLSPYTTLIGMVRYIDYKQIPTPYGNAFNNFFCKRPSFEYEHELRAIVFKPSVTNDIPMGIYIPCDLNILIDEIFVSPDSSDWFKELVGSILEKYSLDREVKRSDLDEDPLF